MVSSGIYGEIICNYQIQLFAPGKEQPDRTITSHGGNYHFSDAAIAGTETVACMQQQ